MFLLIDTAKNKVFQFYFNKTEEYCKILQIDFDKIVTCWALTGRNLLGLHNILEKIVKTLETYFYIIY